jgi:hypothetical protein
MTELMPRRPRNPVARRSEHWLRLLASERPDRFQQLFQEASGDTSSIEWLSPIASDGFAEYYDAAFLERVGLSSLVPALCAFWPASGPRWDGLARTDDGQVILIEAKAHASEMISDCSAGPAARKRISQCMEQLKVALKIPESRRHVSWLSPYYQFCNRIAHLHFLRSNGINAHLVFLHFADAPDVTEPLSVERWHWFAKQVRRSLALEHHALRKWDHDIVISVPDLQSQSSTI